MAFWTMVHFEITEVVSSLFYLIGNKILNFMCEKMFAFLFTVVGGIEGLA